MPSLTLSFWMIIQLLHHSSTLNITIDNAGFETDVISNDNSYLLHTPSNWDITSSSCAADLGLIRPKGGTAINDPMFDDDVPQGKQCAYVHFYSDKTEECGMKQILTGNVVTSDTIYILKAYVANPATNTWDNDGVEWNNDGFPGYRIQLVADDIILAEDDNQLTIDEGHWAKSTVNVTILEGDANIDKTLEIRLINKNSLTSGPEEVYFDDIKLEAIPIDITTTNIATTSAFPTNYPTKHPSNFPTNYPTNLPSQTPINYPTKLPSLTPIKYPTVNPTKYPSTSAPITSIPSFQPLPPLQIFMSSHDSSTQSPYSTAHGAISTVYKVNNSPKDVDVLLNILVAFVGFLLCAILFALVMFKRLKTKRKEAQRSETNIALQMTSGSGKKSKTKLTNLNSESENKSTDNESDDVTKETEGRDSLADTPTNDAIQTPEPKMTTRVNIAARTPSQDIRTHNTDGRILDDILGGVHSPHRAEGVGVVRMHNNQLSVSDDFFGVYHQPEEEGLDGTTTDTKK